MAASCSISRAEYDWRADTPEKDYRNKQPENSAVGWPALLMMTGPGMRGGHSPGPVGESGAGRRPGGGLSRDDGTHDDLDRLWDATGVQRGPGARGDAKQLGIR